MICHAMLGLLSLPRLCDKQMDAASHFMLRLLCCSDGYAAQWLLDAEAFQVTRLQRFDARRPSSSSGGSRRAASSSKKPWKAAGQARFRDFVSLPSGPEFAQKL